ncbi:MAG: hypothetical protein CMB79_11490 [Filomicrobium sp.]|nr:hypothetical protein [Filomicrobium sp.]
MCIGWDRRKRKIAQPVFLHQNKIVPDGITVRLAHFVGQNENLALLNKFRDRFTLQVDAPSASI